MQMLYYAYFKDMTVYHLSLLKQGAPCSECRASIKTKDDSSKCIFYNREMVS